MLNAKKYFCKLFLLITLFIYMGNLQALAVSSCGLQVIIQDGTKTRVPYINLEVCQVANFSDGIYTLNPEYSELNLQPEDLLQNSSAEQAEIVYQYTQAKEISGTIMQTSEEGIANFTVEEGIYLVFERGNQLVAFEPFLVTLPSRIDGFTESHVTSIPKISETDTKSLFVFKLWEDNENAEGKRPGSVEVTVFRDEIPIRKVLLNESNSWQHSFYMLPSTGEYTVKETQIADYESEYFEVFEGYIILNTYVGSPEDDDIEQTKAHVVVRKVWDDSENAAGKRPESVTVQLLNGRTVISTAVLNESNGWEYTFSELDPSGNYTAQEIAVPDYHASYHGSASTGITIVNQYVPETADPGQPPVPDHPDPEPIQITIKKIWDDQENAAMKRPESVTVHLITNNSIAKTTALSSENKWETTFHGLPADLSYTVWEEPVEGYTAQYDISDPAVFKVINTYTDATDPGIPPEPVVPTPVPPEEPEDIDPDPVLPLIPQTGKPLLSVYLALAAGISLICLGIIDIRNGRERK